MEHTEQAGIYVRSSKAAPQTNSIELELNSSLLFQIYSMVQNMHALPHTYCIRMNLKLF
jgi:hypothetical protein